MSFARNGELASHSSNAADFRGMNEQSPAILHNGVRQNHCQGGNAGCNHISIFERECIYKGVLQGLSCAGIAINPKRSEPTISRESDGNPENENYSPTNADDKCRLRRKNRKTDKKRHEKGKNYGIFGGWKPSEAPLIFNPSPILPANIFYPF